MKIRKGFTLIELIVSIALIGIVAVSLLSAFDASLFNISRAGVRTINTYTAENTFLTSPVAISVVQDIEVELPTSDGSTNVVIISGKIGRGSGTTVGSYANVQVDIEAFVPGLD